VNRQRCSVEQDWFVLDTTPVEKDIYLIIYRTLQVNVDKVRYSIMNYVLWGITDLLLDSWAIAYRHVACRHCRSVQRTRRCDNHKLLHNHYWAIICDTLLFYKYAYSEINWNWRVGRIFIFTIFVVRELGSHTTRVCLFGRGTWGLFRPMTMCTSILL